MDLPPCPELLQQEAQGRAAKSHQSLPALNEDHVKRATLTDQISANKATSEKADQGRSNCDSSAWTILGIKFNS